MIATLLRSLTVLGLIFGLGAVSFYAISFGLAESENDSNALTHEQKVERVFVEPGLPPTQGASDSDHAS